MCNELRATDTRGRRDALRNHLPDEQHGRLRGAGPWYNTPSTRKEGNAGLSGGMASDDSYVLIDADGTDP
ncbi:uncharacterized protein A1O9_08749 [Exophiala aquamarina CBS 119918]|uniref:Uncharacterized protein n=1 Tax=Exophiala aquamarina CBS 119918 TaxID=1182545 RepID=A0A072P5G0_9EURO|nr:uncharacterized protein A1O9_08749 [Exophiala aquamarina CBS 119918]KEF55096.1 hypothetical protein A1O9_08749 [Exophiala aquamarina CBS 119918]